MTQSTLYSFNILGIPAMYWLIMTVSHAVHVYLKVEEDAKTNKEAWAAYRSNPWKISGFVVAFLQSSILLVAGWDAYYNYTLKHPDIDLTKYIAIAVAFIGVGGGSLWNNIMSIIQKRITKEVDNE